MMKLNEFIKPDYKNMSDEELDKHFQESLNRLEHIIDTANEKPQNGLRPTDTTNLRKVSSI